MMVPYAEVVHESPGRLRLRIAPRRGDRAYFQKLEASLGGLPSVRKVSGSPLTGSLLVLFSGQRQAIEEYCMSQGLLQLSSGPAPDAFSGINASWNSLERKLRDASGQRWGTTPIAFYGLLGASLWQMTRGRVLPPAVTLLLQATTMFKQALESERAAAARLKSR